jgi:glycyl-tRNA synthetase beta chain
MSDFLLEIFSEEIPAAMQKNAAENLTKIATEILAKNSLIFDASQIKSFVTPCRLTLYIYRLPSSQKTAATKRVGPKVNADPKAIEGFLKSTGLRNVSELKQIESNGQICYLYEKPESEIKTAEILKNSAPQILQKMISFWPKLMRWDVEGRKDQPKWIRPIRNIACMLGSEVIEIEFAGLKSNNLTFTRQIAQTIPNASDYQEILEDNFVMLDQAARKKKIIDQIRKINFDLGLKTIDDEEKSALFDEVAGLCEWPTALLASIDENFMKLPDEVLILTLKLNQKYFCLENNEKVLASKFIFITNAIIDDSNRDKIISDNEKLVRARLSDAEFFVAEDLKRPLDSRISDLKKIVFHQKLGSVFDKISRLKNLSKSLAVFVPHCDLALVERAADLCKVDLTTKAVGELPELQGKIGSFYAHEQKENNKIIAAIYEHYLPLGPNSEMPKTALGIALSIADKIDSVVGFFLADEKPTSSKDPYALRRAVLGIIRISFQKDLAFPIRVLVEKSLNAYPTKLVGNLLKGKGVHAKKELVEEIIKFFVERLKVYLRDNEVADVEVVNVVIDEYLSDLESHKYCDILYLAKKTKFLNELLKDEKYKNLIQLYKRSANILAIEEKKDGKKFHGKPSRLAFKTRYEKTLYSRIKQVKAGFLKLIIKGDFEAAFKLLHVVEVPLAHFFEHVVVNDSDKHLRENRLQILAKIRGLFEKLGDLSKIEIS